MIAPKIQLTAVAGVPLIEPGDSLAEQLLDAVEASQITLQSGDVLVIAQKIVSKAEGCFRNLNDVIPGEEALRWATLCEKDPRLVQLILDESIEVMRHRPGVLIVRHRLGYVHANAGIDRSNIEDNGQVLLLPADPDRSAQNMRKKIQENLGVEVSIIINDSAGRPWRNGISGFAIGTAGFEVISNAVGSPDLYGRPLEVTEIAIADEIAAAGSLLMGQGNEGLPLVHVRGLQLRASEQGSGPLIRARDMDLFQ